MDLVFLDLNFGQNYANSEGKRLGERERWGQEIRGMVQPKAGGRVGNWDPIQAHRDSGDTLNCKGTHSDWWFTAVKLGYTKCRLTSYWYTVDRGHWRRVNEESTCWQVGAGLVSLQ